MTSNLRTDDLSVIVEAFQSFSAMLHCSDWLSKSERNQIKDCILSSRDVESMCQELKRNNSHEYFEKILKINCPDFYYDCHDLLKASDIVLEKVLTAPAVPYNNIKYFLDDYIELCGTERLANVLSSSIFKSEVYRVILDYISGASQKQQLGILVEARILSSISLHDKKLQNNPTVWHNWMKEDSSGRTIAVALSIIGDPQAAHHLALCLTSVLITALHQRNEIALRFWKVTMANPKLLLSLANCDRLLEAALNFLKVSGQWMETTESMEWVSRETGSCKVLGFTCIVSILQSLLSSEHEILHQKTEAFLSQRRYCQGCTLWDDVHMELMDSIYSKTKVLK